MKYIKSIFLWLLVILIIISASLYGYLYFTKPVRSGEIQLTGLSEKVEVIFDDFGVPHIYAQNEEDAHFALGYVHASDRLFQMEMLRRVTTGSLSEILGPELLKTDQLFRTLSIAEQARKSAETFFGKNSPDSPEKKAALAYQAGINHFIETGKTPLEFQILGIPKQNFTPKDFYLTVGFMSFGFAEGLRTDPLVTWILQNYGEEYLIDFATQSLPQTEFIPSYDTSIFRPEYLSVINQAIENIPIPLIHGSNSWIVSGEKSESGMPILANDTHIGFSQPSVWYEAHLIYPGSNLYGNYAAGFPFAILGHNENVAWGITMLENDDINFYVEKNHPQDPSKFLFDSTYYPMESRMDTIKVKGQEDFLFPVNSSRHGPIINGVFRNYPSVNAGNYYDNFPMGSSDPVSLWWTFLKKPNDLLNIAYGFNHSVTVIDIQQSAQKLSAPGLNIMCADTQGNIAWFASAHLIKQKPGINPAFFLDGTGAQEPIGYFPVEENPHGINPPWNYLYSSNNQPDTVNGVFHPGYYLPEDRAEMIVEFLESQERFSADDMMDFQLFSTSRKDSETANALYEILKGVELGEEEEQVLEYLNGWNGNHNMESVAPTIYYTFLSHVMFGAMADELSEQIVIEMSIISVMKRNFLRLIKNEKSPWWDNISTNEKESRVEIIKEAFSKSVNVLTENYGNVVTNWKWGKAHTLTHNHPLGTVELLAPLFNVGPLEVPGGNEVINNLMFALNLEGKYKVRAGPALRKVIDMSRISDARSVLPTGQSGIMMSPHYNDQAAMFATGKTRNLWFSREDVEKNQLSKLILLPYE